LELGHQAVPAVAVTGLEGLAGVSDAYGAIEK
jgi:hypothetical protein